MLKAKQSLNGFTSSELPLARDDDSDTDSFLSAEGDMEVQIPYRCFCCSFSIIFVFSLTKWDYGP